VEKATKRRAQQLERQDERHETGCWNVGLKFAKEVWPGVNSGAAGMPALEKIILLSKHKLKKLIFLEHYYQECQRSVQSNPKLGVTEIPSTLRNGFKVN